MLRERGEADLNALLTTCREAADLYRDEGGALRDTESARLFRELAARRSGWADRLELALRALGTLPDGADSDHETARRLFDRFRAELSASDEPILLARARLEAHIDDLIARAMGDPLEGPFPQLLTELRADVDRARQQLAGRIRAGDDKTG